MREDSRKVTPRVTTIKESLQALVTEMASINEHLKEMEAKTQKLTAKLDDQEGRAQHNNIRLSVKIVGNSMTSFLED